MPSLLNFALDTARAAGLILLDYFEKDLQVTSKSSFKDLVTSADHAAEADILQRIRNHYPEHGILAEESGEVRQGTIQWLIDPLDGTTNFAHGIPHFCVSIAAYQEQKALVGVVHDPVRSETFFAAANQGCFLETPRGPDRRLQVSNATQLSQALLATGFAYQRMQEELAEANFRLLASLLPRIRGIRRAGSAALDLAYVAAGRIDGYWEFGLQPWDTAAGALLVQEAGGIVQQIGAESWSPWKDSVVATGPMLLPALSPEVQNFRDRS